MLRTLLFLLIVFVGQFARAGETIDQELADAIQFLESVAVEDQEYIRFFTMYTIPEEARENALLSLSFWAHSLTGIPADQNGNLGTFKPIAIRDSEKVEFSSDRRITDTLIWLDIRDYNWSFQAFEKVATADPYIRKPWVGPDYDRLRQTAGNALLRLDWFIVHTCDTSRQVDFDAEPLYYELLYAQQKIPKTADEYRQHWGIDVARVEKFGLARGGIVDQGKSIVSRHVRELTGIRTDIGYHWESSDYKNSDVPNDVLENLSIERNNKNIPIHKGIARKADAHEYITTNLLGLQVYFLTDGAGKRIEFADPTIVVDSSDTMGDVRVRTARSCIICHGVGINPIKNELVKALESDARLITTYKDYQQAVERYYFSGLADKEKEDQDIFTRAVVSCNGLTPVENKLLFQNLLEAYDRAVSLELAAKECGVTVQVFKERVARSTSVRLLRLLEGQKIPRQIWEIPNTGLFSQAMLLIKGVDKLEVEPQPELSKVIGKLKIVKNARCYEDVYPNQNVLFRVKSGQIFDYHELKNGFYKVIIDGSPSYIWGKNVEIMK